MFFEKFGNWDAAHLEMLVGPRWGIHCYLTNAKRVQQIFWFLHVANMGVHYRHLVFLWQGLVVDLERFENKYAQTPVGGYQLILQSVKANLVALSLRWQMHPYLPILLLPLSCLMLCLLLSHPWNDNNLPHPSGSYIYLEHQTSRRSHVLPAISTYNEGTSLQSQPPSELT